MNTSRASSQATVGRRQVLAAGTALLAADAVGAGALVGAVAEHGQDDALIAACKEHLFLETEYIRLSALSDGPSVVHRASQAELDVVTPRYREVMDTIADTPALTVAGLRAKARSIMAFHGGSQTDYGTAYPHERMEWSLLVDLAGGDA